MIFFENKKVIKKRHDEAENDPSTDKVLHDGIDFKLRPSTIDKLLFNRNDSE